MDPAAAPPQKGYDPMNPQHAPEEVTMSALRGWNQVIVRSRRGQELFSLAREKGILEVREAPEQALADLKKAAAEKKKNGLAQIVKKSRSVKNLLYLKSDDPAVKKYLGTRNKTKNGKS